MRHITLLLALVLAVWGTPQSAAQEPEKLWINSSAENGGSLKDLLVEAGAASDTKVAVAILADTAFRKAQQEGVADKSVGYPLPREFWEPLTRIFIQNNGLQVGPDDSLTWEEFGENGRRNGGYTPFRLTDLQYAGDVASGLGRTTPTTVVREVVQSDSTIAAGLSAAEEQIGTLEERLARLEAAPAPTPVVQPPITEPEPASEPVQSCTWGSELVSDESREGFRQQLVRSRIAEVNNGQTWVDGEEFLRDHIYYSAAGKSLIFSMFLDLNNFVGGREPRNEKWIRFEWLVSAAEANGGCLKAPSKETMLALLE